MNNTRISYKEFSILDKHFLYDRYSNEFLQLNSSLKNMKLSDDDVERLQREHNILKPFVIPMLSLSDKLEDTDKIRQKLREKIVQLCFIMTENCNMRCKYCVYSGAYKGMRLHNDMHPMTWDIAHKVLDNFLSRGKGKSIKYISFYGGETLLEYKLIKKIVEYVHEIDNEIGFAMNTNLTLLTPEIMEFLIKNDIQITVSLDGPEEVHDLYRVTKNEKPTHRIVLANLKKIRETSLEYFTKKILFNVLIVPHHEPIDIVDKFFSNGLFDGVKEDAFKVLTLNETDNTFATQYQYDMFLKSFLQYSRNLFVDRHINGCTDFSDMRISYSYYIREIHHIFSREMLRLDSYSYYWPNGLCIPGLRSIMVTANGTFYPCETMCDKKQMSMGNVITGIDEKRVINYVTEYIDKANSMCRECWAFRFCAHCFVSCYKNGTYNMEMKRRSCQNTQNGIIDNFKLFMEIYTQNSHAFDYLKNREKEIVYPHMTED